MVVRRTLLPGPSHQCSTSHWFAGTTSFPATNDVAYVLLTLVPYPGILIKQAGLYPHGHAGEWTYVTGMLPFVRILLPLFIMSAYVRLNPTVCVTIEPLCNTPICVYQWEHHICWKGEALAPLDLRRNTCDLTWSGNRCIYGAGGLTLSTLIMYLHLLSCFVAYTYLPNRWSSTRNWIEQD